MHWKVTSILSQPWCVNTLGPEQNDRHFINLVIPVAADAPISARPSEDTWMAIKYYKFQMHFRWSDNTDICNIIQNNRRLWVLVVFNDNIDWLVQVRRNSIANVLSNDDIDWLVQVRRNSIANALELRFSCTNPSISFPVAAPRRNWEGQYWSEDRRGGGPRGPQYVADQPLWISGLLPGWVTSQESNLTHCGLVTPYGDKDLGQHWLIISEVQWHSY